jgi:hypothetical protein
MPPFFLSKSFPTVSVTTKHLGPVFKFEADAKVQQDAVRQSQQLIDFVTKHGIHLDWSDDSIKLVERTAADLHEQHKKGRQGPKVVEIFSILLGSYLGEVYRKNHEAEWGWIISDAGRVPGLRSKGGTLFWPVSRAENRIINGPEDNIWHYYLLLLNQRATSRKE